MSVRSVGGEEIQVLSPVGMVRAAAIPVGARVAGNFLGGEGRRDAPRLAEQTPDQKAEEIVRKTLGSNLEKTMLENLKSVASKFFKLHQQIDPHKREVPQPCTASSTNSKRERADWSQTCFDSRVRGA